ncbi:hypothetical protein H0H81_001161 [Sphagnurus paluster]|uniref:OTU domain-containing protein n=1 Tax=Sphagnurus paluster TaxID=117069 RepID=A0A9P7GW70_9AGAR|nr:hypothetical protein H0H81_001161 [Sphagnurus paluster]
MAGSKKNKQKKLVPPPQDLPTPPVDDELMDDLFAQLDSRNETVQAESAIVINEVQNRQAESAASRPKMDAKARFKARQVNIARKATALEQKISAPDPETEAKLKKEAEEEERDIEKVCQEHTLQIHEVRYIFVEYFRGFISGYPQVNPDGHCLYSAVADQLALLGILPTSQANYAVVRQAASNFMFTHPNDFVPFLAPPPDSEAMSPQLFEQYCMNIRDTAEWGGEPEIQALCRAYNVPIHVIQGGRPTIVVHNPGDLGDAMDSKRVVRISYHRRMYGLGEVSTSILV